MKYNLKGFDQLKKNLSELPSTHSIPLDDLMTPSFISSCSQYSDFEELLEASGFKVEIQTSTSYESWIEMQEAARVSYIQSKLLKGLK